MMKTILLEPFCHYRVINNALQLPFTEPTLGEDAPVAVYYQIMSDIYLMCNWGSKGFNEAHQGSLRLTRVHWDLPWFNGAHRSL